MSAEIDTEVPSTASKAKPEVTHADMFFRYVAAVCQVAGVQAFTLAVAVPKEDGTSAILSLSAAPHEATVEWKAEISKLLGENAMKSAATVAAPPAKEPEVV